MDGRTDLEPSEPTSTVIDFVCLHHWSKPVHHLQVILPNLSHVRILMEDDVPIPQKSSDDPVLHGLIPHSHWTVWTKMLNFSISIFY